MGVLSLLASFTEVNNKALLHVQVHKLLQAALYEYIWHLSDSVATKWVDGPSEQFI